MKRDLSIYLDLLRLIAALGVFLGRGSHLFSGGIGRLGFNAAESVAVFFVLSGFVIAFVTDEKENNWRSYAKSRVVRIYSVTILALIVTIGFDFAGAKFEPSIYAGQAAPSALDFAAKIGVYFTFLNEIWGVHSVLGSNEPYWSLGFEVWYYIVFGLILYLRGAKRAIAVIAALAIVGPYIAIYFLLWLVGVFTYKAVKLRLWSKVVGDSIWLNAAGVAATPLAYFLIKFHSLHGISPVYMVVPPIELLKSFTYFLLIGLVASGSILFFGNLPDSKLVFPDWAAKSIRWLAGGSFTLYLMHLPVLNFLNAVAGGGSHDGATAPLLMIGAAVICYGLAELGERRKRQFAKALERLLVGPARVSSSRV